MKHGNILDYFVLITYFLILVGIGLYFAKKMKGGKDYFSGGNKIPWWVSGIALFISSFSAWTFTGAAGFVYFTGWFGVLYFVTWPIGFIFGSQITAGRWRKSRVISPVEYTSTRYTKTTQQIIGYIVVLNTLFSLGVGLAAVSKVISATMNVDITTVIIICGVVMLFYTFLGGLWAVSIADVVQFVILICITLVVFPLCLNLVGGLSGFIAKAPPLVMNHVYKGETYDIHYLLAILIFEFIAAMYAGQKYYSVKDEKSAKKTGLLAGFLFLLVPILFGIPPIVAKMIWPDLSVVPFFQGQNVPTESVFIAIVLTVLPNGLIGMFMAAMFAASMSAIASNFNFNAAIISKDLYAGVFNPHASDKQIMRVGRIATFLIGVITIITAIIYANSKMGFFYWSLTFLSLFSMPMAIPLVFGLLIENLPRKAGLAVITLTLIVSTTTRFLLGYSFGDQGLAVIFFSFVMLFTADFLRHLYKRKKSYVILYETVFIIIFYIILKYTSIRILGMTENIALVGILLVLAAAKYYFIKLFAEETDEDKKIVTEFFNKLRTPIDVVREVYGKGIREVSTFPMIGKLIMLVGGLLIFLIFFGMTGNEMIITLVISLIMIISGFSMVYFGGRSEKKYLENMQKELDKADIKIVE
jgi:solute:Na+ symporter, SSS family